MTGFPKAFHARPANEKPFVLMPVGYPAADCEVPDLRRKRLDENAEFTPDALVFLSKISEPSVMGAYSFVLGLGAVIGSLIGSQVGARESNRWAAAIDAKFWEESLWPAWSGRS